MKKIEGQVHGLIKVIEEERYCMDILHQFRAVQSALNSVELNILKSHVEGCLKESIECKDSARAEELVDELLDIVAKVKKGRL